MTVTTVTKNVDGSVLTLTTPIGPTFKASRMRAHRDLVSISLDASHLTKGREKADDERIVLDFEYESERQLGGGVLWTGSGDVIEFQPDGAVWEPDGNGRWRKQRFNMACWEAGAYSLSAHRYGGRADEIVDVFLRLNLAVDERGISCTTSDQAVRLEQTAVVRMRFPAIGMVQIASPETVDLPEAPRHRGTSVDGGEVYRDDNDHGRSYLIKAPTAIMFIDGSDSTDDVAQFVETTRFEWVR